MEINRIYFEDCLEGMKRIPDGSIDMVLTDLPYGILKHKGNAHTSWDVQIPADKLWEQWLRIIKPETPVILTATQPFATDLINAKRDLFRYELIWCKSRASGFLNARKMPNKAHENILIFYQKASFYMPQKYMVPDVFRRRTFNKTNASGKTFKVNQRADYVYKDDGTRFPDTLLEFQSTFRKDMHPTEKPLELFRFLIRSYSRPGDLVFDCCMGSGTTAVAAKIEGRNFIGFETERRYFEMANQRILQT